MIHISLFSGIGGFELAAEWMGWRNWVSCDINDFGNKVREYYWPDGYCHKDVKTLTYEKINSELSDRFGSGWRDDDIILTGGFPCQPYSAAGKRLGKDDERHLWPEMLRVISEVKPTYIVGENVRGLTNWNGGVVFEEVCADLENLGYEVQPVLLAACAVGAPHRRDRIWFVANRSNAADTDSNGQHQCNSQHEIDPSQGRQHALGNLEPSHGDGDASNTSSTRCTSTRKNRKIYKTSKISCRERCKSSISIKNDDAIRDATDTSAKRLEGGEWRSANGEGFTSNSQTSTSNSNSGRQSSEEYWEKKSGLLAKEGISGNWQDFPTQSPVCGGDDGLPTKLDSITFSKWRNESIKAYGNAIVPQVAYQIFKSLCPSTSNSATSSNDSPTIDLNQTSPSPMNSGWSNSSEQ